MNRTGNTLRICPQCGRGSKSPDLCCRCRRLRDRLPRLHICQQCSRSMRTAGSLCWICCNQRHGRRRRCMACGDAWLLGSNPLCDNCRWHLRHLFHLNRGDSHNCPDTFRPEVEKRILMYTERAEREVDLFSNVLVPTTT